jgi:hypothetical protein
MADERAPDDLQRYRGEVLEEPGDPVIVDRRNQSLRVLHLELDFGSDGGDDHRPCRGLSKSAERNVLDGNPRRRLTIDEIHGGVNELTPLRRGLFSRLWRRVEHMTIKAKSAYATDGDRFVMGDDHNALTAPVEMNDRTSGVRRERRSPDRAFSAARGISGDARGSYCGRMHLLSVSRQLFGAAYGRAPRPRQKGVAPHSERRRRYIERAKRPPRSQTRPSTG